MTPGDDGPPPGADRTAPLIRMFSRFAEAAPHAAAVALIDLGRQFDAAVATDDKADAEVGQTDDRASREDRR